MQCASSTLTHYLPFNLPAVFTSRWHKVNGLWLMCSLQTWLDVARWTRKNTMDRYKHLCFMLVPLQSSVLTVNPSCCDCVAFLYTDCSSDSSGRQSALDCPRPADTWSANQHPRPLGTLSAACVCRERPLSQSSGKASAHLAISVSGFFESIQLDQVYHRHFMLGNSVIS